MLINPGKLSLAKGIAIFISAFLSKLANQEPKIHLTESFEMFEFYEVLYLFTFLNLVVCLAVRNNSCGNPSS